MKKILSVFSLLLFLVACSPNENEKFTLQVLPVESYVLPDSLVLGTTHTFKIKYKRPSNCYYFEGFYYKKELNQRTIGINTSVLQDNCQPLNGTPLEVNLNFFVTNNGDYIFKFYKGKDAAGTNLFETVVVPVKG